MGADFVLYVAVAVAGFLLKTSLCFLAMSVVVRLVHSASHKFSLWMAFLVGTSLYWISVFVGIVRHRAVGMAMDSSAQSISSPAAGAATKLSWVVPQTWAIYAGPAVRLLFYSYLAILGVAVVMQLWRHRRLRQLLVFASVPDATLRNFCDRLAGRLAISKYRLLILPGLPSPATVGWITPTVLLPAPREEQELTSLSDVIQHELYHIKRRDYFMEQVSYLLRVILIFHPAVWAACSRLRLEREMACDEAVVRDHPENRVHYAESLVRFARSGSPDDSRVFGLDFAATSGHLHTRIQNVLVAPRVVSWWQRSLNAVCSVAVIAVAGVLLPSLTIALAYARSEVRAPLLPAFQKARVALPRKAARVTSMHAYDPRPTAADRQVQPEAATEAVIRSEATPRPHYVLTPPAGTVDETTVSSTAAPGEVEPGSLPGAPRRRIGATGGNGQSVTSAVTGAITQLGRMEHGEHEKNFH